MWRRVVRYKLSNAWQDTEWVPCHHGTARPQVAEANRVVKRQGSHIFSGQSAHRWRWDCQPYAPAGRPLPPGRFLVLISVRGWVDPRATVQVERSIRSVENSNDLIGNRTSDVRACSITNYDTACPQFRQAFLNVIYTNMLASND
jgi:hypothetical protein